MSTITTSDRDLAQITSSQPASDRSIAYLLKTYPKLSETFILNEILELEKQGVQLHLFSLRQPKEDKVHPDVRRVNASVTYVPAILPDFNGGELLKLLLAHGELFWQSPRQYCRAWQFYRRRPEAKRINEFLQAGYLALMLQKLGITHLQAHFANVPTATAEIAQQFTGVSYSIFAHAKDIYLTDPDILDRRIKNAEFILTCTRFNYQYLRLISTSNTPIHLSYHGINFDRFCPPEVKPEIKSESNPPLILSVGRLCEKKGFRYLIQACYELKLQGYDFRCEIVGYGEQQAELTKLIESLQIGDRVLLPGKKDQDELVQCYQQATLFVLPCQVLKNGDRDGIPNVLLEAMAMELPVISTDVSGIAEVVQNRVNGLLVPEKDPHALTVALKTLLNQPKLRQQYGIAGRQIVLQQFSLDHNIAEIKTLLQSGNRVAAAEELTHFVEVAAS